VSSTYYFICLVYNGPNVFVSELLNTSDNLGQDYLDFKFSLHCQELNEDFAVRVQIFSLEISKDKSKKDALSKKSFRMKFGTSSLKRVPKSPITIVHPSPIPIKDTTHTTSFKPVGHIIINLSTVCKPLSFYRMDSYALNTPIDGYLTMNLSLKVRHNFTAEGYFDLQDKETSFWNVRWFVLKGSTLSYWRFPNDAEQGKPPLGVISLKHCINSTVEILKSDQRQLCMRPSTFILVTIKPPAVSNAQKLVKGGAIEKPVPEM